MEVEDNPEKNKKLKIIEDGEPDYSFEGYPGRYLGKKENTIKPKAWEASYPEQMCITTKVDTGTDVDLISMKTGSTRKNSNQNNN